MKAIHKQTNQEYNVEEIIAETVILKNIEGVERRVGYDLFKSQYQLSEGHLSQQKKPGGAKELAKEILTECSGITSKNKAKPQTEKKVKTKRVPAEKKESKLKSEKLPNKKEKKIESSRELQSTTTMSLKDICEELKVTPSTARRVLRREGIEKPGNSWTWSSPQEVAKIKGLLK